jgi:hypothetical protein
VNPAFSNSSTPCFDKLSLMRIFMPIVTALS